MSHAVFSPAFGNRPSQLVGRDATIELLLEGLTAPIGSKERATLLLGQRGYGKTVLLWELADKARQLGFIVANPTIATEGMLERIIEKIQDDGGRLLANKDRRLTGGSIGAFGFSASLQFTREQQETKTAEYRLAHLCRRLSSGGVGVLVLLDEVGGGLAELRRFIVAYQELVGEGLDVACVMAGLPAAVAETLNDRVLTFFNRARRITLGPLDFSDVDAFYASAFARLDVRIDSTTRREAAKATQGSPYLLQLIGYNIVRYAPDSKEVDEHVLREALESARADYEDDICRTTLAALSERDVDFLVAMAEDDGSSRMSDVATRMSATQDYAQKYRRRLLDAGVIEAPLRGRVAFAVPYLADYLRKRASSF